MSRSATAKGLYQAHHGRLNGGLVKTGRIPGEMLPSTRAGFDFGPQQPDLNAPVEGKNLFNHQHFIRSFDNKSKYVGEPRTLSVQSVVAF